MALIRENIVWQSKDGSWSMAFFVFYASYSNPDQHGNHALEIIYDYDVFDWVSTGYESPEDAMSAWRGSTTIEAVLSYSRSTSQYCKELDMRAWEHANPLQAQKKKMRALRSRLKRIIREENIGSGTSVEIRLSTQISSDIPLRGVLYLRGGWYGLSDHHGRFVRVAKERTGEPGPYLTSIKVRKVNQERAEVEVISVEYVHLSENNKNSAQSSMDENPLTEEWARRLGI